MGENMHDKPHRNHDCRIRDYIWQGHRCVSMENEQVRAVFCADKGSDMLELTWKPTDTELLWQSPQGLMDPHDRTSCPLQTGHFRDRFPGGWYVMLPNGPKPCTHRGAEYGFHGEATFLKWDARIEKDTPDEITVLFTTRLRRTPLRMTRRVTLTRRSGTFVFEETITNLASQQVEFIYGHHPCFGAPFLEPGCQVLVPPCKAEIAGDVHPQGRFKPNQSVPWPALKGVDGSDLNARRIPGPDQNGIDFLLLSELEEGWAALVNPNKNLGFGLRWDTDVFPVLGIWQVLGGGDDYPWYGSEYLTALEPACAITSVAEAAQSGRALSLGGHETLATRIEATVFNNVSGVSAIQPNGHLARS